MIGITSVLPKLEYAAGHGDKPFIDHLFAEFTGLGGTVINPVDGNSLPGNRELDQVIPEEADDDALQRFHAADSLRLFSV